MTTRITRSRSRQDVTTANSTERILALKDATLTSTIALLPHGHTPPVRETDEHASMLAKRVKVLCPELQQFVQGAESAQAAGATLIFAQDEAGTAVCIAPHGLLLTCAHCIHDAGAGGTGVGSKRWLLFPSGRAVLARCVAWDARRDLALLQVVAEQTFPASGTDLRRPFPYVDIALNPPRTNTYLHCIGQPGSEDLEASTCGIATDYNVLHISTGRYRGLARGQDSQDNSAIGALRHDCWTYWGHSGAPLVQSTIDRSTGQARWKLVGLHSSWDDETGMRRAVPLQAVKAFLSESVEGL